MKPDAAEIIPDSVPLIFGQLVDSMSACVCAGPKPEHLIIIIKFHVNPSWLIEKLAKLKLNSA